MMHLTTLRQLGVRVEPGATRPEMPRRSPRMTPVRRLSPGVRDIQIPATPWEKRWRSQEIRKWKGLGSVALLLLALCIIAAALATGQFRVTWLLDLLFG